MSNKQLADPTQSQRDRLAFVESRANFARRHHSMPRLAVQPVMAAGEGAPIINFTACDFLPVEMERQAVRRRVRVQQRARSHRDVRWARAVETDPPTHLGQPAAEVMEKSGSQVTRTWGGYACLIS